MLERVPSLEEIESHLGNMAMSAWNELIGFVDSNYDYEPVWDDGGKYAIWEVKYRRAGKTLCAFYVKDKCLCVLVVLGKAERESFELSQEGFCSDIVQLYSNTRQYHDGKWLWINASDSKLIDDIKKLIIIKKKPKTRRLK